MKFFRKEDSILGRFSHDVFTEYLDCLIPYLSKKKYIISVRIIE